MAKAASAFAVSCAQQMQVARAQQRRHVVGPQRERGGHALAGAREVGGAGVDEGEVVGPAELGGLERPRLPQTRLGGVEQLVAEIEQAEGAERRHRFAAPGRDQALDGRSRFLELPRHRRLEDVEHGHRDRARGREARRGARSALGVAGAVSRDV